MSYRNLHECIRDLEKTGRLKPITAEIDPFLEAAVIQRRAYQAGGPALLFTHIKNCRFPMLANLFGTLERTRYLFRDTLQDLQTLMELKIDPQEILKKPSRLLKFPRAFWHLRPKKVSRGPVLKHQTTLRELPQLVSWPKDGGAYITLPQVYSEHPQKPGLRHSNLGMYRVQISGNEYKPNEEIGLHYQTHRGIGIHHAEAIRLKKTLRVNVFVGGAPAMTLAAIMPLPEDIPEIFFAGVLGGRRVPMIDRKDSPPIYAEADFCITGTMDSERLLPEGPFGDHLGYYSLRHPFPVMKVENVFHRPGAVWPFTTVGRPPQEDTVFGAFIHEITAPVIPTLLPGVKKIHAVDAAGVHPLLLAIGSERYTPYAKPKHAQELLTQAHALLGQGQLSLSKYIVICDEADNPHLDIHDIPQFFKHVLERVLWERDLHFQTHTTIDTLDYSGTRLHQGSKLVITATGSRRRGLATQLPNDVQWPEGFHNPRMGLPGILVIQGPPFSSKEEEGPRLKKFCDILKPPTGQLSSCPLIIIVDDSEEATRTLNNLLWIPFTRSNPASDIYGIDDFTEDKHWGCRGPLVIDARIKPHHAPILEEDPQVVKRIEALGTRGQPLHGII